MPYRGERANKTTHVDIIKNPDVSKFLEGCDTIKAPSQQEGASLADRYIEVRDLCDLSNVSLPEGVLAIDGSLYESSINDQLPSTRIGYIRIGAIYVNMGKFGKLRHGRLVDPFKVAELRNENSSLTFVLPSANIRRKDRATVRESFRAAVDEQLYSERTRFDPQDPSTSLRTTLFHLACLRPEEELYTGDPTHIRLKHCPTCKKGPVDVYDVPDRQFCNHCGNEVFPSDCLRLWEEVSEYQSNLTALSRFAMVLEHLIPIHYIRRLMQISMSSLSKIVFFLDRPLAIFGNSAWIHRTILQYLDKTNKKLAEHGLDPVLLLGFQKTGQVVDHVRLIRNYLKPDTIFAIDDEYRYKYICSSREASEDGFGADTYYGQDFIFKTASGREFVFALPYPCASKSDIRDFHKAKTDLNLYPDLPRAIKLIEHFECDLYDNAVVPIALAHRYTAISVVPGGRVLDIFGRQMLTRTSSD